AWQIVASATLTLVCAYVLWHRLPSFGQSPRFRWPLLQESWRFAAGLAGTSFLTVILTQTDKVILSKMLTLEMFGYYSVAYRIASALLMVAQAVFTAVFPVLSQLESRRDDYTVAQVYHRVCQSLCVLIVPPALVICLFSREILQIWTHDATLA